MRREAMRGRGCEEGAVSGRGVCRGTYMYWKRVSWEVGRAGVALRWWLSGTCR